MKASLSSSHPDPNREAVASPSEISDKIKALRSTQQIEPGTQSARTDRGSSSGEEPVTARIRRRTKAASDDELANETEFTELADPEHAESPETHSQQANEPSDSSVILEPTYRDRVSDSRRRKEYETSVS